jgi:hypothetical protein
MGLLAIRKHGARPRELGQSSFPLNDFLKNVHPFGEKPILNVFRRLKCFLSKKEFGPPQAAILFNHAS